MSLERLSNKKLAAMAQRGERSEEIFNIIYSKHNQLIKYHALKILHDEMEAEDVMQETFTKAFMNINQYKPTHAFTTWLYSIATHNCIDKIRKNKNNALENGYDLNELEKMDKSLYNSPEEEMTKREQDKTLHEAIDGLKDRYKNLVKLRYLKEYSYKEVAEELKLPIGTVKAQLFRARELLNNSLKDNSLFEK